MTMPPERPSKGEIVGRAILYGIAGAVIAPIVVLAIVATANHFNSACGTPGDSGGCEMGLAAGVIAAPLPGFFLGAIAGIVRSLRR